MWTVHHFIEPEPSRIITHAAFRRAPPPLGPAFQGAGGPVFRRVGYEFDLDPESVQEIPTAVAHSLAEDEEEEGEEEDRERHTNYLMEVCGCMPCDEVVLAGWKGEWVVDLLVGWMVGWLVGWLIGRLVVR